MKRCPKCEETKKEEGGFYKDSSAACGYQGVCISCRKSYAKTEKGSASLKKGKAKYRNSEKGSVTELAYQAKYNHSERGKSVRKNYKGLDYVKAKEKKWADERNAEHPEKRRARDAINGELRAGRLKKLPCVMCGSTHNIEGHHPDYTKPLLVVWLCKKHHVEAHFGV